MKPALTPNEIRKEYRRLRLEIRMEKRQSKKIVQALERELLKLQGLCPHSLKPDYRFAVCPDCGFASDEPH